MDWGPLSKAGNDAQRRLPGKISECDNAWLTGQVRGVAESESQQWPRDKKAAAS